MNNAPDVGRLNLSAVERVMEAHGARCYAEGLQRGLRLARDLSCWLTAKPSFTQAKLKKMLDERITHEDVVLKNCEESLVVYAKHVEKLLGGC